MLNIALTSGHLERYALPDHETCNLLQFTARRFNLSARAYGRILRVARTIADLAASDAVTVEHVSEALLFRQLDGEGRDALLPAAVQTVSRDARRSPDMH